MTFFGFFVVLLTTALHAASVAPSFQVAAFGVSNAATVATPSVGANAPKVGPIAAAPPPPQSQPQPQSMAVQARPAMQFNLDNPIVQLDYSTISDELLHKRTANFIFFTANYNHCRHCHKFSSIWRQLALDIRAWRQIVRLFTINCSDEDNIEACRGAGVNQLPQVKYYWIMSNSLEQDGQRLRILGKSVHAMRHLIMDRVLDSYMEHVKLLAQRQQQRVNVGGATGLNSLLATLAGGGKFAASANTGGASGGGGGGGMPGISQMISALMSVSTMRRGFNLQPVPGNWPELEQIETSNTKHLLDQLPLDAARNIGALLIMETQEFLYTGLEVMFDLNPYGNATYLARVRDERSQLCRNLTKRDNILAPALIFITKLREPILLATAPKYTNDEDLRRIFVRAFERSQIKYPIKRVWLSNSRQGAGGVNNGSESEEDNKVYMSDLIRAIRVSLMEQVFIHPDISDDQYNALVKYVYALINYFPFNNDEHLKFFKRLHTWLQNQVSPMDSSEYKKQFHDFDDILGKRKWIACKSLGNANLIPTKSRKQGGSLYENTAQIGKLVSNITHLFRNNQQKAEQLKGLFGMLTKSNHFSPVMLSKDQHPWPTAAAYNQSGLQPATKATNSKNGQQPQPPLVLQMPMTTVAPVKRPLPLPPASAPLAEATSEKKVDESPIERIIKGLTSGSLGSDSSILKLISSALTGGGDSSSSGKSKFAREYPCGAWKVAHVMVVNEYIKDSPRKDVRHIVLHSIYQYMLQFYACPTCGNRVSDVSGEFRLNLDDHLTEQGDSVMLLWKLHNRVNKRLEGELRPGSPHKQQFPSEALCPKCRTAQNDLASSTPNWNEKQVLAFLVHHYRPQSINAEPPTDFSSSSASASALLSLNGAPYLLLALAQVVLASAPRRLLCVM